MLPFRQRIARIALQISDKYGFALAGGYALTVNGINAGLLLGKGAVVYSLKDCVGRAPNYVSWEEWL